MVKIYKKADLVEDLTLHTDVKDNTKAASSRLVEFIFDKIKTKVAEGYDVDLYGFVNMKPDIQKGKSGKVPGTDKTYTSPEKKVVRIKATKPFKDLVANS